MGNLCESDGEATLKKFFEEFENSDEYEQRLKIANFIREYQSSVPNNLIISKLNSQDPGSRLLAVELICRLTDPESKKALIRYYRDPQNRENLEYHQVLMDKMTFRAIWVRQVKELIPDLINEINIADDYRNFLKAYLDNVVAKIGVLARFKVREALPHMIKILKRVSRLPQHVEEADILSIIVSLGELGDYRAYDAIRNAPISNRNLKESILAHLRFKREEELSLNINSGIRGILTEVTHFGIELNQLEVMITGIRAGMHAMDAQESEISDKLGELEKISKIIENFYTLYLKDNPSDEERSKMARLVNNLNRYVEFKPSIPVLGLGVNLFPILKRVIEGINRLMQERQ